MSYCKTFLYFHAFQEDVLLEKHLNAMGTQHGKNVVLNYFFLNSYIEIHVHPEIPKRV